MPTVAPRPGLSRLSGVWTGTLTVTQVGQCRFAGTPPPIRMEWTVTDAGELTIHGVTNPIELHAELGGVDRGPEGELRTGFEVTGQLSRKDYGMRFNAALGSGNAVVADKVKLALDVELIRRED